MLQTHISYQFNAPVWRLEIDPISNIIFVEVRNQADKQVYFAGIDLTSGKILFDKLQTEERWLTGIEAAYDVVLLIHNYQSEAGPAHKGLTAIDGSNGKILWNNYTHAFDHLSINGPVIYDARMQPRKLLLADIHTGATKRPYQPSIDTELNIDIILPDVVTDSIPGLINLPTEAVGNTVHYLEYNNFRIVSLHAFAEGTLQQRLYIIRDGEMVFEDLMNTDIQKLQPESFLIYKHHLIYLKNKSQLKVLNL